jgi:hypothetical protein
LHPWSVIGTDGVVVGNRAASAYDRLARSLFDRPPVIHATIHGVTRLVPDEGEIERRSGAIQM